MKSLIFLSVCFTIFALIIAWVFFVTEGRFKTKLIASATLVFLSVNLAFSFNSFLGYPSKENWVDQSYVVGVVIREPNLYRGDEGAVYLWLREPKVDHSFDLLRIFKFVNEGTDPRAYALPYTKPNQIMAQQAQEALKEGKEVLLTSKGNKEGGKQGNSEGQQYNNYDLDDIEDQPQITVRSPGAHRPK